MDALLAQYPHVVAWVAGHSHVNSIEAHPNGAGGFWSVRVAAEADWPQQSRLLEVFDNEDGTLSLFGTILDHASDATAPAAGTAASGMTEADLASVGRTLSANDPQAGTGTGEGAIEDRNVELLIADPRTPGPTPQDCDPEDTISGTPGDDDIPGNDGESDRIKGRAGNDRVKAGSGDDCAGGGRGRDKVDGEEDDDRVRGGRGADRVKGGAGSDSVKGGRGSDIVVGGGDLDDLGGGNGDDRIRAADGFAEQVRCGPGTDRVIADREDTLKGCERVTRA